MGLGVIAYLMLLMLLVFYFFAVIALLFLKENDPQVRPVRRPFASALSSRCECASPSSALTTISRPSPSVRSLTSVVRPDCALLLPALSFEATERLG
jgi:hypothetical protein